MVTICGKHIVAANFANNLFLILLLGPCNGRTTLSGEGE